MCSESKGTYDYENNCPRCGYNHNSLDPCDSFYDKLVRRDKMGDGQTTWPVCENCGQQHNTAPKYDNMVTCIGNLKHQLAVLEDLANKSGDIIQRADAAADAMPLTDEDRKLHLSEKIQLGHINLNNEIIALNKFIQKYIEPERMAILAFRCGVEAHCAGLPRRRPDTPLWDKNLEQFFAGWDSSCRIYNEALQRNDPQNR